MIRTGTMAKRKRSEHYVNNKEFLAALIRYREDVEIAKIPITKAKYAILLLSFSLFMFRN